METNKNLAESIKLETKERFQEALEDLKQYLSIPTISAQNSSIPETAAFAAELLRKAGGTAKILDDLGGNPVIYGFFQAGEKGDPNTTLLFYNHYDVQPPEPLNEWNTPPFHPTISEGCLFARGAADNKGDLIARLTAINVLQSFEGGLPCNIKFLIEGEEEIGSPNLEPYLKKYQQLFKADACIWEFGSKDDEDRVSMVAGIKGMAYLELTCTGADIDMHSSVGAYVDNAAWRLVQALATMKNKQNDITVKGFYDGITEPTEMEKEAVHNIPFNDQAVMKLYGLKRPLITADKGKDPREAMVFEPTMTICGIESGYTGTGAKTVLPKNAKAKIDCRLVPGQDPEHVLSCIQEHLKEHGFTDITVEMINGQKAYRSPFSHPFVQHVAETAKTAYNTEVVLAPNAAGTGPMYIFGEYLKLPIVSTGIGWAGSKAHAPNESIRLKDFEQGINHMALMLSTLPIALQTV